jgi:hypothetical protein
VGSGVAAEASGERSEAGGGVGGAPCGASACCCRFLLSSASQGGTAADTSSTAGSFAATPELVATGWLAAGAAADGSARSRAARIQGGSSLAAAVEAGPGRLVLSAAAAGDGRTWAGAGSADGAPLSPSERSRAARRRSFSSSIAGEKPSWKRRCALKWRMFRCVKRERKTDATRHDEQPDTTCRCVSALPVLLYRCEPEANPRIT